MVSQFGSLGYTITGKTADLTVVQKTIIDSLHKEGKPQTFIAKEAGCSQSAVSKHVHRKLSGRKKCGRKRCTTNERTAAFWGLSSKIDSIIWVNFTRTGLRLGSRHQEPPHTDVSRNLATIVVRGVLPGLRRRRTGMWSKVIFSDESKFCISFESQGPRVWRKEKLIAQVAWSPVLSFHSLWWFEVQSSAGVGPLCFLKTNVTAPVYREMLEHFMLPSADQLFKDAEFIFQQDLAPAHTAKSTKSWINDHGVLGVLDWPAKNADELKSAVKETWASIPPQQWHKLITSMPRQIEAVIKAKGAPTKYWVHIQ